MYVFRHPPPLFSLLYMAKIIQNYPQNIQIGTSVGLPKRIFCQIHFLTSPLNGRFESLKAIN